MCVSEREYTLEECLGAWVLLEYTDRVCVGEGVCVWVHKRYSPKE